MRKLAVLLLTALAVPVFAFAGDGEFDVLVRKLESEYGARRMYIPFFGVANFFVKIARPAGARDVKLAIFEDIDESRHPSAERLDDLVRNLSAQKWKPFVRVQEGDRERIQIYARPAKNDWELLMAIQDGDEAIVLRVRLRPEELSKWIDNPVIMARAKGGGGNR